MTQDNIKTVAFKDIAFDEAPYFCRNGMSFTAGKGYRLTAPACVSVDGQPDVTVEKGSVLFRDKDGHVSFHTAEEFEERFCRLLKNGAHVRLSRADNVQLLEIRQAEDERHLKDWAVWKGHEIADNSLSVYRKVVTSDIFRDVAMMTCNTHEGGRELANDVKETLQKAWQAPENDALRAQVGTGLNAVKKGLQKIVWGKLGQG